MALSKVDPIRRAKIVCTIGPASNSEEMIRELMLAGMDVARLNFSHGAHEEHAEVILRLRKVAAELNRSICILQDLQGPKIRTGRLKDHAARYPPDRPAGHHHLCRCAGHVRAHSHYLSRTGERRETGRTHSAVGWPHRTGDHRDCRWQRRVPRPERRRAGRASGHQPAGHERQHPVADRERRSRSRLRIEAGSRCHRHFFRSHGRRRDARAQRPLPRAAAPCRSSPSWRSRRLSTTSTPSSRSRTA